MAKLRINGDSSGYVDLEAPNAASSSTLDLDQVPQKNVANTFTTGQNITVPGNGGLTIQAGTNGSASLRLKNDATDWDVNCQTTDNFAIYNHTTGGNRLGITPAGIVTTPSQPSFYAYASGGGIASSNSYTTPGFDNISHNIGNHWNTSTVTFTAPVAGYYYFHFTMYWNSTNGYSRMRILKNSSTIHHYNIKPGLGGDHSQEVSGIIGMAANDTVKPQMMSDNSNNYFRAQNHSYFEGYLLG
jgi:hypothetical protein